MVHTADINAVFLLVQRLSELCRRNHPEMPDVSELFLKLRKEQLHLHLEKLETQNPGLAAKLQELIDQSSTIFPYT